MAHLLLIDDDADFSQATAAILSRHGHEVSVAVSLAEAREHLAEGTVDLQLVDLALPDGSGMELLTGQVPPAIVMTGHPSVETAVRALRGNVVDYLVKPLDRRELLDCVDRAVLSPELAPEDDDHGVRSHLGGLVGESAPMQKVYKLIEKYGASDATVLILGESGTGKDLVARALHKLGSPKAPYVPINCGAIPQELIASELFGHEKGAFTGAAARRRGVFERAGHGTVFLDEITELPLDQQVALLRVLENRTVTPVGSEKEIAIKARVIAASNRKLEKMVTDGEFREDLYYRLMVLPIRLPPLRERMDDVPQLAAHFLHAIAQQRDEPPATLSDQALERLGRYRWPGNVRELKHTLLRACVMHDGGEVIEELPDDFERPLQLGAGDGTIAVGASIKEVERQLIEKTLSHFGGDKKRAAEALGVSLKTLYNRLNEYRDAEASDDG